MLYKILELEDDKDERAIVVTENANILLVNKNSIDFCIDNIAAKEGIKSNELLFPSNQIKKLIILLTNSCNLRCRYCYLDYGNYKNNEKTYNIDINIVNDILDKLYNTYDNGIHYIQFFGGEPLIAFQEIKKIVEYIETICRERNLQPPKYGIVTNGVLLDIEKMSYFNEKNISIMVSIDGDRDIHNRVRKSINASDTFALIKKNICSVTKQKENKLLFEMTINREHLQSYKEGDASKWFQDLKDMGFIAGNVGIIEFSQDRTLDFEESNYSVFKKLIAEMVQFFFHEMKKNQPMFNIDIMRVLMKVIRKDTAAYSCGAGVSQLTLTTDGEILPCPKFAGSTFVIKDQQGSWDNSKIKEVIYNEYKSGCESCWAKNLCIAYCYSLKYRNTEDNRFVEGRCWHVKAMTENVIKCLINAKINGEMNDIICGIKRFDKIINNG